VTRMFPISLLLFARAAAGLALVTPVALSPSSFAEARTQSATAVDRSSGCRIEVAAEWAGFAARWHGECPGSLAHGLGVLRLTGNGNPQVLFFGRATDGRLVEGAARVGGGYVAGRFERGAVVPTENRQDLINAFHVAAAAAREVSARFRRDGNAGSAVFYADMARQLANQMD